MLELKLIMALTVREFSFSEQYEAWDKKLGREKPGNGRGGQREMFGELLF